MDGWDEQWKEQMIVNKWMRGWMNERVDLKNEATFRRLFPSLCVIIFLLPIVYL